MIPGDPLLQRNPDGTWSSVLQNKLGITGQADLDQAEYALTALRSEQIRIQANQAIDNSPRGRINQPILDRLREIHNAMFQDVYSWSGCFRALNIGKKNPETGEHVKFRYIEALGADPAKVGSAQLSAALREFTSIGAQIDSFMASNDRMRGIPKIAYASGMATLFHQLNMLHPFREGNGRATRELIRQVAREAGYDLQLDGVTRDIWIRASNDRELMAKILEAASTPLAVDNAPAQAIPIVLSTAQQNRKPVTTVSSSPSIAF